MARPPTRKRHGRYATAHHARPEQAPLAQNAAGAGPTGQPQFAQPVPSRDPGSFSIPHASDTPAFKILDSLDRAHELLPTAFPHARGGKEPVLTLEQVMGDRGAATVQAINAAGQLVFHSVGDTGNTRSTEPQNEVADKLVSDFAERDPREVPRFYFHLGDVIYNFGEAKYYYDQFYDPYRDYPAPILGLAGNHDGMVAPQTDVPTLAAYLQNFCATEFEITPEAGGLDRTAMIQPGVYYTFEAPFLRIFALYSNTLEDPGVISTQGGQFPDVTDVQLAYLEAALKRAKQEKFAGALIIAHHHPIYTAGDRHGWSPLMQKDIDGICEKVGLWPHAVLSGHAHNYQRFTRNSGEMQTPYVIAGNGGHAVARLTRKYDPPLRVPMVIEPPGGNGDRVVFESYDDQNYGYLRIIVTAEQLRIQYHPASDGPEAKTPDDFVTVDLKTRKLVHFTG
jgi:Calcineurin-like phosphoesterase